MAVPRILAVLLLTLLGGCATLPDNVNRTESRAYNDTQDTRLGRFVSASAEGHGQRSGFLLLGNGLDAFLARGVLAQMAERSIDAQYYLLHGDLTGRLFIDQLLQAADRGVRVRLLVDDMDLAGRDMGAAMLDSHPNVEVRIYNPFSRNAGRNIQFITRLGSVTRRMHNKSFTVDNQMTILGGRNIGDEYFAANPQLAFSDLDVLGIGPVAHEVSQSFDRYWNHALAYPVTTVAHQTPTPQKIDAARREHDAFVAGQAESPYLQTLRNAPLATALRREEVVFRWGDAKVFYDDPEKLAADPDKSEYRLVTQLAPFFNNLASEVIIFSPYFVPGKQGVAFLKSLRERGVRVRILTNSLASTDVSVVHAGYARYRKDLLRAGIELYEMSKHRVDGQAKTSNSWSGSSKASLHAKSFVLDRDRVFIGSMNLDPRSVVENTEIGVVVEASEIAGEMARWFDENVERVAFVVRLESNANGAEQLRWYGQQDGASVVFDVEPYTSFWKRFVVGLMGMLPIESQL